jgi:hypothetical protein
VVPGRNPKVFVSDLALLGVVVVALSALPGFAASQEQERAPEVRNPRYREILERWDKDGDGRINDDERAAMKEALVAKHDADGDGQLNDAERAAAVEAGDLPRRRPAGGVARGAREKRLLEKFDKDGDGQLSEEERQAAREAVQKRRATGS